MVLKESKYDEEHGKMTRSMLSFTDADELKLVLTDFWGRARRLDELLNKLGRMNIKAQIIIPELDFSFIFDFTTEGPDGKSGVLVFGSSVESDDVDLIVFSDSETSNKFWQGKIRSTVAVIKGEIKIKGSITKSVKLISKLGPLYPLFVEALRANGLEHMII